MEQSVQELFGGFLSGSYFQGSLLPLCFLPSSSFCFCFEKFPSILQMCGYFPFAAPDALFSTLICAPGNSHPCCLALSCVWPVGRPGGRPKGERAWVEMIISKLFPCQDWGGCPHPARQSSSTTLLELQSPNGWFHMLWSQGPVKLKKMLRTLKELLFMSQCLPR